MKWSGRLISLAFLAVIYSSGALANDFGLGIILFGPTGFSGNYALGNDRSVDGALSWSLNDRDENFYFHSTYLWHKKRAFMVDRAPIDVHFGIGGRYINYDHSPRKKADESYLGARGAIGVGHTFSQPRIEIFGEIALTMDVIPETEADLDFGIGARFYF